ncbi:hypothetical protein AZZ65_003068, partial [Escherichia coli]
MYSLLNNIKIFNVSSIYIHHI